MPSKHGGPAPNADAGEALDVQVRREDPDRWLATRLIGAPRARLEVVALYAFHAEVSTISTRARQPIAGELRLAWWLEALERARVGVTVGHPTIEALAISLREGRLSLDPLERIIEAYRRAPDARDDDATRIAAFDDTSGALMHAAAVLLDPAAAQDGLLAAGRAWGWSGVALRSGADEDLARRARSQCLAELHVARGEIATLPVASFPAVAYLTFLGDRLAKRRHGELGRRARLLVASATGRL